MLEQLLNQMNTTVTENGAITNKSTKSELLDFFSLAGSMRNRNESDIIDLFNKAFNENPNYALKALFFMRDVRQGNGERRLFRICVKWLAENHTEVVKKNLKYFSEYGRYDDLLELLDTKLSNDVIELITQQLNSDLKLMYKNEQISLLAKWMPSENASSPTTIKYAKKLRKGLRLSSKDYRKTLTTLRKYLDVLEIKMSSNQWDKIDFTKVPSQASLKYRGAFYRNDGERYEGYLESLEKGEVKVNTSTIHPYQLVEKVLDGYSLSAQDVSLYNSMWNNLSDVIGENYQDSIAVIDVSGSMSGTPMNVAISLGLYIAEKNKGAYRDHFITFSENPQIVQVEGNTFCEKVDNISRASWGYRTNLESTFNLILNAAIRNNLPQDSLPKALYIISDMEFDSACGNIGETFYETMRNRYAQHGYVLPRLVFWNVDARQNQSPIVMDTPNVQTVSGFSHNLFASMMSQKEYNPYDFMIEVLDSERYSVITA